MKKKLLVVLLCVIVVILAAAMYLINSNGIDDRNPIEKKSMVECTIEWGRLADFPDSKSDFIINTEGSSFTRSFRCSFYIPKNDLDEWIRKSPGLKDAEIQTLEPTKQKYIIRPGGGAGYAEAIIDSEKCFVQIYVSWS